VKPILRCFGIFIRQIARDNMLWVICLAPLLTAFIFRFGLPFAETLLCSYFQRQAVLADYYLLFDLCLCLISSCMLCFASAMVMLTERDENMTYYITVTPVGKKGYILSRLVFPAAIAFFFSILLTYLFTLTDWNLILLSVVSLLMSLSSTTAALLIFSFSGNRVEGMAMAKMASLIFLGIVVPFFVYSDVQYLAAVLPTFWVAKLCREGNNLLMLPTLAISIAWLVVLARRYARKLY